MIPTAIFQIWLTGLLSLGIIGGGVYLLREWYQRVRVFDPRLDRTVFSFDFGANEPTALLVGGVLLLLMAVSGHFLITLVLRITKQSAGADRPDKARSGRIDTLRRPDGTELRVERHGPEDGPTIVLTHGWGTDSTEWYSLKRLLPERFRVIAWDLPGHGKSSRSPTNDYSLERFAGDLDAVIEAAGGSPPLLVGHSIGGMIMLTHCRLFDPSRGSRVAGLVLVHTTYTNPVRTTVLAGLWTALERPVLVPLIHLTIWLSPLVHVMNWLSYWNGSAHLTTMLSGFGGTETWQQIDFAARYTTKVAPAVLARGMLGMLRYDATGTLAKVRIPTLVVAGNQDPVCKPEASQRIRSDVRNAALLNLKPARHMGFMEHGGEFRDRVGAFAAEILAADLDDDGVRNALRANT